MFFSVLAGIIPLSAKWGGGHLIPFAPPPCLQVGELSLCPRLAPPMRTLLLVSGWEPCPLSISVVIMQKKNKHVFAQLGDRGAAVNHRTEIVATDDVIGCRTAVVARWRAAACICVQHPVKRVLLMIPPR